MKNSALCRVFLFKDIENGNKWAKIKKEIMFVSDGYGHGGLK